MEPKAGSGPAFPTTPHYQKDGETQHFYAGHYGMTLRDYFAAKAMQAWISNGAVHTIVTELKTGLPAALKVLADGAFAAADAMLAAREQ